MEASIILLQIGIYFIGAILFALMVLYFALLHSHTAKESITTYIRKDELNDDKLKEESILNEVEDNDDPIKNL